MARTKKADLDALADIIIYHRRDDGYYVEYAYGQPRLYLITDPATGRVREVSPRLPARELKLWLDGYTTCLMEGTQNPPVGVPTDVLALVNPHREHRTSAEILASYSEALERETEKKIRERQLAADDDEYDDDEYDDED